MSGEAIKAGLYQELLHLILVEQVGIAAAADAFLDVYYWNFTKSA